MEIERKFLLKKLPDRLDTYTCYSMEQAYITTSPVIRVRKKTDITGGVNGACRYILTIKSKGFLSREEYEIDLDEEGYNNVLAKAEGNIIQKNRYVIPLDNNLKLELDLFKGKFDGLVLGEIEFPNEEAAKNYTPPEYFSEEVTYDRRFSNSSMSKMEESEISELIALMHIG